MTNHNKPPIHVALLPCPFCGGEAKSTETKISAQYHTSHVRCLKCGATIGDCGGKAIELWNTRSYKEAIPMAENGPEGLKAKIANLVREYLYMVNLMLLMR